MTISLVYHDVVPREHRDSAGFPGDVAGAYKLDPGRFAAHLDALAATGAQIGPYAQRPDAVLTFDDGGASALPVARELEQRGWRGAFFVVTARIGTPGFVDADGVRELVARGHEVGSHSHTHPAYMARLATAEIADQWRTSRELLAELLGARPRAAAVPGGSVSRRVIEQAALAGYEQLYTSTPRAGVGRHGVATVIGRYTIWAGDPPELAAALVRGAYGPRARRWLAWQVKSAAKRVCPRAYEALRHAARGRAETMRAGSSEPRA
jgi:peptidoglycan/xylan/chitin deacetylase (PgdA/CDA1 family)